MISLAIGRGSRNRVIWCTREPTITEMLSDSLVMAMMKADGVDPVALEAQLRRVAAGAARCECR
jgi:hypothetical protein